MCRIAIITLIGYWRFTGTPTQTVLTVGNNETKPLRPDSLLGGLTSESRISEAKESPEVESFTIFHCEEINRLPITYVVDERSRRVHQLSVAAVAYWQLLQNRDRLLTKLDPSSITPI